MSEAKVQILTNGQEITTDDVNTLGEAAGFADDRVFAELLRMAPYTGTVLKGILPYSEDAPTGSGTDTFADDSFATVAPSGSSNGTLLVRPFRAFVGARTAEGTDSKLSWRDVRSAIYLGSPTARNGTIQITTANASGQPRWDLLYAAVAVDQNTSAVTRYTKDPITGVITSPTAVVQLVTTVTLGTVTGTASATPARPSIPSDAAGVYYVPLAYVRIPTGYTVGSSIAVADIWTVAPVLALSRVTGASTYRPANGQNAPGVGNMTTTAQNTWASSGVQPKCYLPSTSVGSEKLLIALDLKDASSANWSLANYAIVDSSRNWRKRIFHSWAQSGVSTEVFAWLGAVGMPGCAGAVGSNKLFHQAGNSFQRTLQVGVGGFAGPNDGCVIFEATDSNLDFGNTGATVTLYVDLVDGSIRFWNHVAVPLAYLFVSMEAIGPISGY